VTSSYGPEITANWERAERSLQAAQDLTARGYYDIAASRRLTPWSFGSR